MIANIAHVLCPTMLAQTCRLAERERERPPAQVEVSGRRRVPAEIAEELRNAFVRELEMTKVMDVDKRLTAVNRGLFCQALSALVIFLAHDEACRLAPAGQSAAPAEAVTDHQSHRREQDHHL